MAGEIGCNPVGDPMEKWIDLTCNCGFKFPQINYMGDYYCPKCGMRIAVMREAFEDKEDKDE